MAIEAATPRRAKRRARRWLQGSLRTFLLLLTLLCIWLALAANHALQQRKAVAILAAVATLREVRVRGTGVTGAGTRQLRGRLPSVRVSR